MSASHDPKHRSSDLETIVTRLGGPSAVYYENARDELDGLSEADRAVLQAVDRPATVRQVVAACGLHPVVAAQTMHGLIGRGVLWHLGHNLD